MSEIADMYKGVKEIHDHIKRVKEVYGKEQNKKSKKPFPKSYCNSRTKSLPRSK